MDRICNYDISLFYSLKKLSQMKLMLLMKELAKNGVATSINYDFERDEFYIDLDTRAKSELHLYENGLIRGRYNYENHLNFEDELPDLIRGLCYEFSNALHGRNYYNQAWAELCRKNDVRLTIYYK
jgi:hypothetical protein